PFMLLGLIIWWAVRRGKRRAQAPSAPGPVPAAATPSPQPPAATQHRAMPTAIIAEDEAILRTQLATKLAKLWPELEIVAQVEDGAAALEALEERAPDFMFLDIRMPEMTGVEVARLVGTRSHVVFVTAYDEYA